MLTHCQNTNLSKSSEFQKAWSPMGGMEVACRYVDIVCRVVCNLMNI